VSLTRVGVRGIEKVIRVGGHRAASGDGADGPGNYFFAELECFVDLNPRQAGVHMSRFEEVVGEAIDGVVLGEALRAEELATHIAVSQKRVASAVQGATYQLDSDDGPVPASGENIVSMFAEDGRDPREKALSSKP